MQTLVRPSSSGLADDFAPPSPTLPLLDLVDEGTRELIERRRGHRERRRGWLVRRALAAADVVGILLAFALTQLALGGSAGPEDRVGASTEILLFATLPALAPRFRWPVVGLLAASALYGPAQQSLLLQVLSGERPPLALAALLLFYPSMNLLVLGAALARGDWPKTVEELEERKASEPVVRR